MSDAAATAGKQIIATTMVMGRVPDCARSFSGDDMPEAADGAIWRVCLDVAERDQPITPVAVSAAAKQLGESTRLHGRGDVGALTDYCAKYAVAPAQLPQAAAILRAHVARGKLARESLALHEAAKRGKPVDDLAVEAAHLAEHAQALAVGPEAKPTIPNTICIASVEPRPAKWLWSGRLAMGEMIVLTGAPGAGKGLLLCYVVARYTTGRPLHGDRVAAQAGDVLWVSVEDSLDSALALRLRAAGADTNRVHAWNMDRPLSLPEDTDRIVSEIVSHHCGIVIIDPAPTVLDREHSSNNDADVRRSFSALATACRTHGACLILVRHTNKRSLGSAMDRGGGSIAWTGMARVELMLGRRPIEEGATGADVDESVVTLAPVKSNLGRWPRSLNMRIVEVDGSARMEVIGETDSTADDLCAQERPRVARKAEGAEGLLRRILGDGQWHPQREIEAQAESAGISHSTMKRAKSALGVKSRQRARGWEWCIPRQVVMGSVSEPLSPWSPDDELLTSKHINSLEVSDGQGASGPYTRPDGPLTGEDMAAAGNTF